MKNKKETKTTFSKYWVNDYMKMASTFKEKNSVFQKDTTIYSKIRA